MKIRIAAAIFAVAALLTPACEQHKWSETKVLFKGHEHGDHTEGDHGKAGHGDTHGAEKKADSHGAEAAPHGEKKAH